MSGSRGRWLRAAALLTLTAALLVPLAPDAPVAADGNEAPGNPAVNRAITAGDAHTCALTPDHSVKCWGNNALGQLGLGDTATRGDAIGEMGDTLPALSLGTGRTATAIAAGGSHTCALLDNGTVKCWGRNVEGQLGQGDVANRGDAAGEMGDTLPAVSLGTGRTATAIAAGGIHTCAILDNATVKCWGSGAVGRLGSGNVLTRGDGPGEMGDALATVPLGTGRTATAISANSHTCVILDNATLKCWGFNSSGQLGLGDTANRGDGAGEMSDSLPAVSLGTGRTVTGITAGGAFTCARLDDATVKCWGENVFGALGLGDQTDRGDNAGEMGDSLPVVALGTGRTATAITAGASQACAGLDNGTVKCWGNNINGQLGVGSVDNVGDAAGEMGDALRAVELGLERTVSSLDIGVGHICAVLDNGTLKCWGSNGNGRLGLGDVASRGDSLGEMGEALPAVSLGTGRTATAVTAGSTHTCAILDNGTVKCWGSNASGELGLGDVVPRGDGPGEMGDALPAVALGTGRTAVAIGAGDRFTCALLDNATIKCWGLASSAQLGTGDTLPRGDAVGEMGNALPAVSLGTGRTAVALSVGNAHTCALLDNDSVKCWGSNGGGRLGLGDTNNRGDVPGEMGDSLPAVSLGTGRTATALAAGSGHTCVLLDNGTVKCWGNNGGQLGLGDSTARGDNAGEMGDSLPVVSLGTGRTATTITAGANYNCVRLDNTKVKCWGIGSNGQLAQGDTAIRGDAPGEMGDALPTVSLGTGRTATLVVGGNIDACARLDDGSLKCWGGNSSGQLGQGDALGRGDNPGEMGDALLSINLGAAGPSGLSGTVVDAVSGAPIPGAFIAILRSSDFSMAAAPVADGSGKFTVTLPPSGYRLYLVDPAARHTEGFSAGSPLITVPADTILDVDPTMAPKRGRISGTVTEDGSGTPIPGAFAIALNGATGTAETGVVANGSGVFNLTDLPAGPHFMAYVDPAGNHAAEFFPNSPTVPGATPVTVTAGGNAVANDALATQTAIPAGAALTGTITEQGTGSPLANVFVIALRASDFKFARATTTNGAGAYSLSAQAGQYKLAFLDGAGLHAMEWHNNQPNTGLGTATSVTAPAVTNAALDRTTGSFSGTITDDPSNNPIAGAWVIAIGPTGIAGATVTAANGTYSIAGLPPGTYRASFVDPTGGRTSEYFDNQPDFASATTFNVTAGADLNGVDGLLALP